MTNTLRSQLVHDSNDLYNKYFKWFIVVFIAWYVTHAVLTDHKDETENGILTSTARDTGLKMTMSEFPPSRFLNIHATSGMLLCVIVLVQKQTVLWMLERSYAQYKVIHKYLGYVILLLICGMVYGGYMLGLYSAFPAFSTFSIFFAAPFAFWTVAIYYTARPSMISVHRLLGNMLLKGCVAVPLSRIGGAFLQNLDGWNDVSGFYQGIGGTAMIIVVWQGYELFDWWCQWRSTDKKSD
jgi:hypothetical protein